MDIVREEEEHPRGFWALIITQFLGAFNDNAFKNLLTVAAVSAVVLPEQKKTYVSTIGAAFIIPFLLLSMYGGYFADRFSKRSVSIVVKTAEICIMLLGAWAFRADSLWLAVTVLVGMGIHSAFFGPTKYGIIPELVPEKRISWANGILELTTFLAIIGGTWAGTVMYNLFTPGAAAPPPGGSPPGGFFRGHLEFPMLMLAGLAVAGTITATMITKLPAAAPAKRFNPNFFGDLWNNTMLAYRDRVLWLSTLGSAYFWFIGMLVYSNVISYGPEVLGMPESELGYIMVAMMLGIGLGSYAAGELSGNKIEIGFVPLGALMVTIFGADLFRPGLSIGHAMFSLMMLGAGSGFFIVPLQALIQYRPDPANKGGILGMAYFYSNVATLGAAGFYYVCTVGLKKITGDHVYFNPRGVFLLVGLMTLAVGVYAVYLAPDSLVRLKLWFLGHTLYRIRTVGRDNIPERGGALFVSNHVSFADVLFITATTDRHIRFIMHSDFYERLWLRPFAKMMGAIPISSASGPRAMIRALREASRAVEKGDVVCIFAEGQITRTGQLLPFRRGFERIMRGVDAPIIPVHLDRVWGSIFSFEKGRFLWKWPHRIPYRVTVSYGRPMPADSNAMDIRRAVQELSAEAAQHRRDGMHPLHREFIASARKGFGCFAMADGLNPRVSFVGVLARSIMLGMRLRSRWAGQEMVGLLLPPSVAGASTNIAALMCGKVPVNLNYTSGREALESAIAQCRIEKVVTSRAFLEKAKLSPPPTAVYLEDVAQEISRTERIAAMAAALLLPAWAIEKMLGSQKRWKLDDLATVIFSSGSTGDPKGVMLSHYNILSNVEGIAQVMAVTSRDRILGVLPFFHSFGFTGTLWFPMVRGFAAVYHPNPMDARTIGALADRYCATIMAATPTFLQSYIRRVEPGMFGSLRFVLVGAEKLPERVAAAFEDRFGLRPYEAYGTTECSPAVAINVPGFRAAGFYQVGSKRAHIGHPLPGVTVRIADTETFEPLPSGREGLLLVKGPNVMLGYLGKPEKTAEVMRDGWYVTGDIAVMDEDGFLAVTDRLSRFSKIGGEMVPHVKVEDELHRLAGADQQCFAVTGVPDERRGERLAVLHTLGGAALQRVAEALAHSGLPNLWIPKADAFVRVDALPVLGTGKMDLRKVREVAAGALAGKAVRAGAGPHLL